VLVPGDDARARCWEGGVGLMAPVASPHSTTCGRRGKVRSLRRVTRDRGDADPDAAPGARPDELGHPHRHRHASSPLVIKLEAAPRRVCRERARRLRSVRACPLPSHARSGSASRPPRARRSVGTTGANPRRPSCNARRMEDTAEQLVRGECDSSRPAIPPSLRVCSTSSPGPSSPGSAVRLAVEEWPIRGPGASPRSSASGAPST
jgi:hypothetical protein